MKWLWISQARGAILQHNHVTVTFFNSFTLNDKGKLIRRNYQLQVKFWFETDCHPAFSLLHLCSYKYQ